MPAPHCRNSAGGSQLRPTRTTPSWPRPGSGCAWPRRNSAAFEGRYQDVLSMTDSPTGSLLDTETGIVTASLRCEAMAVSGNVAGGIRPGQADHRGRGVRAAVRPDHA